jgi:four helix bundle protein
MEYNLEGRTKELSKSIIKLSATIGINDLNRNIVNQLLRSATSVGANYMEANGASSRKDFINKIYLCRKEIQETKYWLELLAKTNTEKIIELRLLWKESHELTLIFNKISTTLRKQGIK